MVKCIENKHKCKNWKVGNKYGILTVNGVKKIGTEWGLYLKLPQDIDFSQKQFEFGMCKFHCL